MAIERNPSNTDAIPYVHRTGAPDFNNIWSYGTDGGSNLSWDDLDLPDLWLDDDPTGAGGTGGGDPSNAGGGGTGNLNVGLPAESPDDEDDDDSPAYVQPTTRNPFQGVGGGASGSGDSVSLPEESTPWAPPIFMDDDEEDSEEQSGLDKWREEFGRQGYKLDRNTMTKFKQWLDDQSDGGGVKDAAAAVTQFIAKQITGKAARQGGARAGIALSPTPQGVALGLVGGQLLGNYLNPAIEDAIGDLYGAPNYDDMEEWLRDYDLSGGQGPIDAPLPSDITERAFEPVTPDYGGPLTPADELGEVVDSLDQGYGPNPDDNLIVDDVPFNYESEEVIPNSNFRSGPELWEVPKGDNVDAYGNDPLINDIAGDRFYGYVEDIVREQEIDWGDGSVTRTFEDDQGNDYGYTVIDDDFLDKWKKEQEKLPDEQDQQGALSAWMMNMINPIYTQPVQRTGG